MRKNWKKWLNALAFKQEEWEVSTQLWMLKVLQIFRQALDSELLKLSLLKNYIMASFNFIQSKM
jgi:hypothetical protein